VLRTDRGGEFTSKELGEYFANIGVKRQLTAPYTPQQNGVVEWRNQIVVSMARSLLKAKGVPTRFWGEAITTAVYLLNRGVTKNVDGKTPFEAWHGHRPSIKHLCVFGCVVHVKNTRPNLKKLEDMSVPMVLLGYEPGSAAYRVYDPATQRVQVSWNWTEALPAAGQHGEPESFAVEFFCVQSSPRGDAAYVDRVPVNNDIAGTQATPLTPARPGGDPLPTTPAAATPTTPAMPSPPGVKFVSPPLNASQPSPGEEAPRRYRMLQNLFDSTVTVEPGYSLTCLSVHDEPASFTQAEKEQAWRAAMNE
jgi:hypothetical protein